MILRQFAVRFIAAANKQMTRTGHDLDSDRIGRCRGGLLGGTETVLVPVAACRLRTRQASPGSSPDPGPAAPPPPDALRSVVALRLQQPEPVALQAYVIERRHAAWSSATKPPSDSSSAHTQQRSTRKAEAIDRSGAAGWVAPRSHAHAKRDDDEWAVSARTSAQLVKMTSLGTGFGDRFKVLRGDSRCFEEGVQRA
jgi:hypothetical protein